jgi:arylsulfatase
LVGWDAIREARYKRQIEMGLIDPQWELSPRAFDTALNDGASAVGSWEKTIDPGWQAQRMAVYAAMIESLDRGVGRIVDALNQHKIDRNTVVIFLSDNGGCQENVEPNWYDVPAQTRDGRQIHVGNDPHFIPGPEEVFQSYGPAWANASNTPFRRFKHFTEEGGIATPFIVSWPGVVPETGTIQHDQVGDVIDLMPTILDIAGADYPGEYHGHKITPLEGQSLFSVFKGGPRVDRSGALCWEHEGNRAVRIDGWKLVAAHGEKWQLYDMAHDRTELHDVTTQHPEIVAQLHEAYDAWVKRVGVEEWPIKD